MTLPQRHTAPVFATHYLSSLFTPLGEVNLYEIPWKTWKKPRWLREFSDFSADLDWPSSGPQSEWVRGAGRHICEHHKEHKRMARCIPPQTIPSLSVWNSGPRNVGLRTIWATLERVLYRSTVYIPSPSVWDVLISNRSQDPGGKSRVDEGCGSPEQQP